MRGPVIVGVLAGILLAALVVVAFVLVALGDRPSVSTPPTRASPLAPSVQPPSPTLSPTLSPSAEPTLTSGPSPSPSSSTSASASSSASAEVGLEVGDIAPGLSLERLGGGRIDTARLAGQPLWINFMATWCPPCRDELPLMGRFQTQLGDEMTILLVDIEEDDETVRAFMDSLAVDLPVGLDGDGSAQQTWGAVALPVHYWIDEGGRISAFVFGGAEPDAFIDAVRTVLPRAELEP